jgi:glutamate racemase
VHLVITDSGLGGLSICAELARRAAAPEAGSPLRLTYVNAWPEEGRGYNDLPDMAARASVFDRALTRMAALAPDRILIACNTLSIVYPATVFSRSAPLPVQGIVDTGVALFAAALAAEPSASIVLLGTRTTIDSRVHHDRLVALGIDARRVSGVSCHGLATAIERDIDGPAVDELIAKCAADARAAAPIGALVLLGLCCTHYGYVADRIVAALARALQRPVRPLDPNLRMVDDIGWVAPGAPAVAEGAPVAVAQGFSPASAASPGLISVISKVTLAERTRHGVARLVEPVSPATARALLNYTHVPDLF